MGTVILTQLQERQIRDARSQGTGYRGIASIVGLDRDTVRNYCKRHNLDLDIPCAKSVTASSPSALHCPLCGLSIEQPPLGRRRKFCSEQCRRLWWKDHQGAIQRSDTALYSKVCVSCKKPFVAYGNAHRKYCCRDCYIQGRFKNINDNSSINHRHLP